jgi:hypothetical protein
MIKIPNTPFNTTNNSLACSFENEKMLNKNTNKLFISDLFKKLEKIADEKNA